MTTTLNLEARRHHSTVLATWAESRPGALQRIYEDAAQVPRVNAQTYPIVSSDAEGMKELFAPISSASGFAVNDRTAMAVSTVYACLSKLSGAVLQLPAHHYRVDQAGDRERVRNSPLWWLLNEQPHARWTAASWKEWIVRCVALRGDQYTRIVRSSNDTGGRIIGLEPLHPDMVVPRVALVGGADFLVYDVTNMYTGMRSTVHQDDMLHFPGFGFNGMTSLSAIQYAAKQAIGNSLAAAEYSGRTIGEGAMPQIALQYPNKFNPAQSQQLRDSFVATYGGHGGRKLPLVLTEGGTVKELSISPVDLELIAMRGYEKADICEALGVPPILIGSSEKVSSWGTGIEQITLGFVKFTIQPMLCRWEEELNRKLFRVAGQFVEFELDGLQRGDSKAQAESFRASIGGPGTGNGWRTVNEVRKLLNLPPDSDPASSKLFKASAAPVKKDNTSGANDEPPPGETA